MNIFQVRKPAEIVAKFIQIKAQTVIRKGDHKTNPYTEQGLLEFSVRAITIWYESKFGDTNSLNFREAAEKTIRDHNKLCKKIERPTTPKYYIDLLEDILEMFFFVTHPTSTALNKTEADAYCKAVKAIIEDLERRI